MANKRARQPVAGKEYRLSDNGVIAVKRRFPDLLAPYRDKDKAPDYLSLVDHSLRITSRRAYRKALIREAIEFNSHVRRLDEKRRFLVVVFQGLDASGKSGATERLMRALDYDHKIFGWVPIGPPTEEEKAHFYLWRFFKHDRMPQFGHVRVFDRSWFERVLVEPVEKHTAIREVRRSYAELRALEWLLVSQGAVLVKFWLDISKAEQLRRFRKRAVTKPDKVSPADMKTRKKWSLYQRYANEMFYLTGTPFAPWHIVSSEDKWYSRVSVLQTVNRALRKALGSCSTTGKR